MVRITPGLRTLFLSLLFLGDFPAKQAYSPNKVKSAKALYITEEIVWILLAKIYAKLEKRYPTLPKEAFLLGKDPS